MSALRAAAPGKVNLCLFVGPVRPDGRHELVSLIEAVSLADDLELAPAPPGADADQVVCGGVEGPNLAAAALAGFRAMTGWDPPPQRLTVTKRVPVAGGMGGGSADAAAALRLAAAAAGREGDPRLSRLAAELGSDVPAALKPGLALVTGAGQHVRRLAPLPAHGIVVVALEHRLPTAAVFAQADRLDLPRDTRDLAARRRAVEAALEDGGELPAELWRNDLERAARGLCPPIEDALEAVRGFGVDHVMVSGSGPTVVAIQLGADGPARARAAAKELRPRFPGARAVVPVGADHGAPRAVEPAT